MNCSAIGVVFLVPVVIGIFIYSIYKVKQKEMSLDQLDQIIGCVEDCCALIMELDPNIQRNLEVADALLDAIKCYKEEKYLRPDAIYRNNW